MSEGARTVERRFGRSNKLLIAAVAVVSGGALLVSPGPASGEVIEAPSIQLKTGQRAFTSLADMPGPFELPREYDLDVVENGSRRGEAPPTEDWCTRKLDNLRDEELPPDANDEAPCREWAIKVVDPDEDAWRLRVAVDLPPIPDASIDSELWRVDASGNSVLMARKNSQDAYMSELTVYDPEPGTWVLRAVPVIIGKNALTDIRARAALESVPRTGDARLVPNLRPEVPAFLFAGCAAFFGDTPPTPDSSGNRCMRFQLGYQNVGTGPLELDFAEAANPDGTFEVDQVLFRGPDITPQYTDNPIADRIAAGTATYHETHAHFHYDDILNAQLYKVVQPGQLEPYKEAAKFGNCAHDGIIAGFKSFGDVQGQADSGGDCSGLGDDQANMRIGLSTGWADLYDWDVADNYVEFPGHVTENLTQWVLRVRIDDVAGDADGHITETKENDNVGYTYFEWNEKAEVEDPVEQGRATVLERGRGTDPWDPDKTILTDYGQ